MHRFIAVLVLTLITAATLAAQTSHRALRRGDKAYKDKNYAEARKEYDASLADENSAQGNYNLGNALYEQGDFEEAAKRYEEAASLATDDDVSSRAYRNLADAQYRQEKYEDAVESYKRSLRINPDDKETKYNLSKAIRQIQTKEEQQQQEQQGEQGEGDDQQQQEGGEGNPQQGENGQESQGDQNQQQQQQDPQNQDQDSNDSPEGQTSSQGEPDANQQTPRMSRAEAERQLEIAAAAEKETMKRLRKGDAAGCRSDKEW